MPLVNPTTPPTAGVIARRPTAVGESISRLGATLGNQAVLSTGTQYFVGVALTAGTVVSKITFQAGATAAGTPTNQFFGLWSQAGAPLALTADDLTTAWNANTEKQLTLASPYTVPLSWVYLVSCMVKASSVPTLRGITTDPTVSSYSPIVCATDSTHTGLTTPASAPATATYATTTVIAWCWLA